MRARSKRRSAWFAAIAGVLLAASGCQTIVSTILTGPRPYGGVHYCFKKSLRSPLDTAAHAFLTLCCLIDLPMSFALDTALLPITIWFITQDREYGFL